MRLYLASTSPARLSVLRGAGIEPICISPEVDEDAAIEARQAELGRSLTAAEFTEYLGRLKAEDVVRRYGAGSGGVAGAGSAGLGGGPGGLGGGPGGAGSGGAVGAGSAGSGGASGGAASDSTAGPGLGGSGPGGPGGFWSASAAGSGLGSAAGGPIDGLVLGGDSMFVLDGEILGKPHLPDVALERAKRHRGRTGVLYSGHWLIDHTGGKVNGVAGSVDTARVTLADDVGDGELAAYVATGEPLELAGGFAIDGLAGAFIERIEGAPSCVIGLSLPALRRLVVELGHDYPALWGETA